MFSPDEKRQRHSGCGVSTAPTGCWGDPNIWGDGHKLSPLLHACEYNRQPDLLDASSHGRQLPRRPSRAKERQLTNSEIIWLPYRKRGLNLTPPRVIPAASSYGRVRAGRCSARRCGLVPGAGRARGSLVPRMSEAQAEVLSRPTNLRPLPAIG